MPIYVEARNIDDRGGLAGGHLYLVYIPEGSETDYDAWKTIGAFPEISGILGPWGLMEANRIGEGGLEDGAVRGATDGYIRDIDGADPDTYQPTPS